MPYNKHKTELFHYVRFGTKKVYQCLWPNVRFRWKADIGEFRINTAISIGHAELFNELLQPIDCLYLL